MLLQERHRFEQAQVEIRRLQNQLAEHQMDHERQRPLIRDREQWVAELGLDVARLSLSKPNVEVKREHSQQQLLAIQKLHVRDLDKHKKISRSGSIKLEHTPLLEENRRHSAARKVLLAPMSPTSSEAMRTDCMDCRRIEGTTNRSQITSVLLAFDLLTPMATVYDPSQHKRLYG
ncbi:hypothetical protein DVH05_000685 [Phytophthora capsici]|nr:hypothetical protein DVH05_000685 [Phytophthora capsici]